MAKNLEKIESGLKLYQFEGTKGVEYAVDNSQKRIDILAIDANNVPVVIELKVSKGYEKAIGQCQYYKNKLKEKLNAEKVRVIIIAETITEQLLMASKDLEDYQLFEYILNVEVKPRML